MLRVAAAPAPLAVSQVNRANRGRGEGSGFKMRLSPSGGVLSSEIRKEEAAAEHNRCQTEH